MTKEQPRTILALLTEQEALMLKRGNKPLETVIKMGLISKDAKKWQEWNIELIGHVARNTLRCKACGATWSPDLQEGRGRGSRGGKKLAPDYWKCPTGCNKEVIVNPDLLGEVEVRKVGTEVYVRGAKKK